MNKAGHTSIGREGIWIGVPLRTAYYIITKMCSYYIIIHFDLMMDYELDEIYYCELESCHNLAILL